MGTGRLDCQKAGKGWMLMRRRQKKKHPVRKFLRNMIASLLCIVIVFCLIGSDPKTKRKRDDARGL